MPANSGPWIGCLAEGLMTGPCQCRASQLDMAHAEIARLKALNRTVADDVLAKITDMLADAGAKQQALRHTIEGARDSFRNLAGRINATFGPACECHPGFMCIPCTATEAAKAMESALRGDTIPTEDSPEDIAAARAAWPENYPSPQEKKGKTE